MSRGFYFDKSSFRFMQCAKQFQSPFAGAVDVARVMLPAIAG